MLKVADKFFRKNHDYIHSLFRIAVGLLFLQHGAQKLYGWFGGNQVELMSLMGAAGMIEFYGGLLIAFGLLTRYATLIGALEMGTAWFTVHIGNGWIPIVNQGELALLYLVCFVLILSYGPGKLSIDKKYFKNYYW